MSEDFPVPENEWARLECLRSFQFLGTLPDESFDRFTRLVSRLLQAPVALISLIDADRQWIKSATGIAESEFPRGVAFCVHTICSSALTIVDDARQDARFRDNPLVTADPGIRSYAGAPIVSPKGHAIGTIAVADFKPRTFDEHARLVLTEFSAAVMDLIRSHRRTTRALAAEKYLFDAVNVLTDGFVLYDSDDRLLVCNDGYRGLYKESAHLMVPGTTFEDIIRFGVARGQYPEAAGREEEWIAERLERHRNPPDEPIEQLLPGDRWLRIRESQTHDGGRVGFRFDITELKRNQRKLAELAWTDSLTGVLNRRRFFELANAELNRARRTEHEASLLAIDIDKFKRINDNYGHAAGDQVLVDLAARWAAALREYDILGRLGGEEFVVYLPDTDRVAAGVIAERLRYLTQVAPIFYERTRIEVTTSIGIAEFRDDCQSLEQLIADADKALYEAKNSGRNRVCLKAA